MSSEEEPDLILLLYYNVTILNGKQKAIMPHDGNQNPSIAHISPAPQNTKQAFSLLRAGVAMRLLIAVPFSVAVWSSVY